MSRLRALLQWLAELPYRQRPEPRPQLGRPDRAQHPGHLHLTYVKDLPPDAQANLRRLAGPDR